MTTLTVPQLSQRKSSSNAAAVAMADSGDALMKCCPRDDAGGQATTTTKTKKWTTSLFLHVDSFVVSSVPWSTSQLPMVLVVRTRKASNA